jgi:hypothetical protein
MNWISEKALRTLAPSIAACAALQVLDLGFNRMTRADALAIASAIDKCRALHTVRLDGNDFEDGVGALLPTLQWADLQVLELLPDNILSRKPPPLQTLGAGIQKCRKVSVVHLRVCHRACGAMLQTISNCRATLRDVNLDFHYRIAETAMVPEFLSNCPVLECVKLRRIGGLIGAGASVGMALAMMIAKCKKLRDVDVSIVDINDEGEVFVGVAVELSKSLETLHFDYIGGFGSFGDTYLAQAVATRATLGDFSFSRSEPVSPRDSERTARLVDQVDLAQRRARARRTMLAWLCGAARQATPASSPAHRFSVADGDRSVAHRVFAWLAEPWRAWVEFDDDDDGGDREAD